MAGSRDQRRERGGVEDTAALVARAQTGDREAFQGLYRLHVGQVHRFVGSIVRNARDAEDATAETYLHVWRDLPRLRDPRRYEPWLLQIAHRRAIDQLRRRRPVVPLEDAASVREERRDRSPHEAADIASDVTEVRRALAGLPEAQRTVLTLRYLFEMSHDEIASSTGRSAAAVRQLRQRALASLRRTLNE